MGLLIGIHPPPNGSLIRGEGGHFPLLLSFLLCLLPAVGATHWYCPDLFQLGTNTSSTLVYCLSIKCFGIPFCKSSIHKPALFHLYSSLIPCLLYERPCLPSVPEESCTEGNRKCYSLGGGVWDISKTIISYNATWWCGWTAQESSWTFIWTLRWETIQLYQSWVEVYWWVSVRKLLISLLGLQCSIATWRIKFFKRVAYLYILFCSKDYYKKISSH